MLLCLFLTIISAQNPHGSTHDRGAAVMGFDQTATQHHFSLFADGGAIAVDTRDTKEANERDAIRAHLSHIAMMFGSGNFDTPAGGRIDIVTADPAALSALHDFRRYQIREPKTGDAVTVTPRQ